MAKPLAAASVMDSSLPDFSSWMQQEQPRIYRLCRQMLQDAEEADAATQDAFCKAWRALDKVEAGELTDPRRCGLHGLPSIPVWTGCVLAVGSSGAAARIHRARP